MFKSKDISKFYVKHYIYGKTKCWDNIIVTIDFNHGVMRSSCKKMFVKHKGQKRYSIKHKGS